MKNYEIEWFKIKDLKLLNVFFKKIAYKRTKWKHIV